PIWGIITQIKTTDWVNLDVEHFKTDLITAFDGYLMQIKGVVKGKEDSEQYRAFIRKASFKEIFKEDFLYDVFWVDVGEDMIDDRDSFFRCCKYGKDGVITCVGKNPHDYVSPTNKIKVYCKKEYSKAIECIEYVYSLFFNLLTSPI